MKGSRFVGIKRHRITFFVTMIWCIRCHVVYAGETTKNHNGTNQTYRWLFHKHKPTYREWKCNGNCLFLILWFWGRWVHESGWEEGISTTVGLKKMKWKLPRFEFARTSWNGNEWFLCRVEKESSSWMVLNGDNYVSSSDKNKILFHKLMLRFLQFITPHNPFFSFFGPT